MMDSQTVEILHVSNKLVTARLTHTIWPIFSSFLIFCCYLTRLKTGEISQQNMKFTENIFHIVLKPCDN